MAIRVGTLIKNGRIVGSGGDGGAGFTLGPETNEFTSVSARNTYATNNADWLADYDANPSFLVAVTVSSTTTFYRRNGSAWEDVTPIIRERGARGLPGTNAPQLQLRFSTDGTNFTEASSTTDPTTHLRVSVDGGTTFITFELDSPVDGIDGVDGTNAPQLQLRFSTDGTNFTSTPSTTDDTTHIQVSVDGGTAFTAFQIPAGPAGTNAPQLQVEYSTDGTNYTDTASETDTTSHLRVSTNGGTTFEAFQVVGGSPDTTLYKGDWDTDAIYGIANIVSASNILYISQIAANTGNDPATDTTNWSNLLEGGGISEAAVITLIEERDDVIDGTPDNIPDASVDQKLKLAPDNSGVVRTLVEKIHYAVARAGTFSVYTHAHYRGPFAIAPYPGTDTDDIFYHTSHEHFEKVTLISAGNYQWRTTSFAIALGSDAEWLGHQPNQATALAQIGTFDNTKSYYAYTSTDQNIMLLDNSSYVAGSGEGTTYEWRNIVGDTAERVARLEGYTPTYWAQVIDEPTYITGDDTETIDTLNVKLLNNLLEAEDSVSGQLIFGFTLEKVTALRVDTTIRIKHGTATIHTESVPLQNANTEFTSTIKVNVDDVSDGITVEIQTENSNDTTEDVEVSEVKLGILASASPPQATSQELLDATETRLRSYSPSQLPELVHDHETYPWAHSIELEYNTNLASTNIIRFKFTTVGETVYLDFSSLLDLESHNGLYLKHLENHDEFAVVTVADKSEIVRGEFNADFDETGKRIEVINKIPDTYTLTSGTNYLLEFTRSVPGVGLTQSETQDEALAMMQDWARAKTRQNDGSLLDTESDTPIPLDRKFENLPITWDYENASVEYYEESTSPSSSADLQIKIVTIGSEKYLQVPSTSSADIGHLEVLKKYDLVGIFYDGDYRTLLIATEDWDATNGLQVNEVWNDLNSQTDDYDNGNNGDYLELRHTGRAGGTDGEDGADGRFRVVLYQNKTGTAPTAPTNITYTFTTEALANLGDWSQTRTAPSSGETTYEIIDTVDPDTTDTSVTLSFNTPVALLTGGELEPTSSRRESITFQAITTDVVFGTNADPLTAIATNPISVKSGTGAAEIMTATSAITGGGTAIRIAKAGDYIIDFVGIVNEQNNEGRVVPGVDVYNEADTVGTDEPIGTIQGHYGRNRTSPSDKRFERVGVLTVDSDNTDIKVVPVSVEGHGSSNAPFRLAANGVFTISRFGGAGLTEAEVEDFVSEHIRHTIRRRLRVGAGVLEVGDVRFDATSIEINVSQDTEDGWFGDIEVGAEIRIHGQTSGARSQYTFVSATESGDDATITVTRDSHSGIFSHNETVVIIFDQEHAPQSDYEETDENRPAYIKNKPPDVDVIDRRETAPDDVSDLPDNFRAIETEGKVSGLFFRSDEDNPYFEVTPASLGTGLLGYSERDYSDLSDAGSIDNDAGFEAFYEEYNSTDDERRWRVRYGFDAEGISQERTYASPSYSMFDSLATGIDATLEFEAAITEGLGIKTFISGGSFVTGSDNVLNIGTSAVTIDSLTYQHSTRQFSMIRSGGTPTVNTMATYWGTGNANDQNWYSKSVFIRFADGTVAEVGRDAQSDFAGGLESATWTIRSRETRLIEKLNAIATGETIVMIVADRRSLEWTAERLLEGNVLLKFEDSDIPIQMKPVDGIPYGIEWASDAISADAAALTAGTAFDASLYDDEGNALYTATDKRVMDIPLVLEKNAYPKYCHFYHEGADASGEDFLPSDLYPDDTDVAESRRNLYRDRAFVIGRAYSSTNDGLPLSELDFRTGDRGDVDVHVGESADDDLIRRTVVRPSAGTWRFYANVDLLTKQADAVVFLRLLQIKSDADRVIDVMAEGSPRALADDNYLFPDDDAEPIGGASLVSTPIECDGSTDFVLIWGTQYTVDTARTDWKCANMRWGFEMIGR